MLATGSIKVCSKCCHVKPLEAFYKNRRNKDGLSVQCKDCIRSDRDGQREWSRRYYQRNRAAVLARKQQKRYGAVVTDLGDRCAIGGSGCRGSLCIDHDHACCPTTPTCGGCTRGVLCWWHNRLLGTYEAGKLRDPALVEACEEYLRGWLDRHGATMEPSA